MFRTQHERMAAAAKYAKTHNVPSLPLFRAALAGHIELILLFHPEQRWPAVHAAQAKGRPSVALVCDDSGPVRLPVGPTKWASAPSLRDWAVSALVHGSGPAPWHYGLALAVATTSSRIALVETSSVFAEAWARWLDMPTVVIVPPGQGMHPHASQGASA